MKTGMIAVINIILALAALARDMVLAVAMGTGAASDAFILSFSVPDMIGNNVFAVSAGMAAIPLLTSILMKNGDKAFSYAAKTVVSVVAVISIVFFISGHVFRRDMIGLVGQGPDPSTVSLAVTLLGILMPAFIFSPLFTVGGAILNIRNKFFLPSFAPVVFNMIFLAGIATALMLVKDPGSMVVYIAISVTVGTAAMAVIVWTGIMKSGALAVDPVDKGYAVVRSGDIIRSYISSLLPYMIVYAASQSVLIAERIIASGLGTGIVSGLNYAYRIASLPTWIFVAAIGTVALPSLSRINGSETSAAHESSMMISLGRTVMIAVPFTVFIFFMREPLVEVLLGRGAFGADSIIVTSGILSGYSLSIIGQGVIFICLRFFLSMKYVALPALTVIISSAVNIAADIILIRTVGYRGLGIGAAVGASLGGCMLLILLDRKTGGAVRRGMLAFSRILVPGLLLVFPAYGAGRLWLWILSEQTAFLKILFLMIVFFLLGVIYYSGLRFLRAEVPDLNKIIMKLVRRRVI